MIVQQVSHIRYLHQLSSARLLIWRRYCRCERRQIDTIAPEKQLLQPHFVQQETAVLGRNASVPIDIRRDGNRDAE